MSTSHDFNHFSKRPVLRLLTQISPLELFFSTFFLSDPHFCHLCSFSHRKVAMARGFDNLNVVCGELDPPLYQLYHQHVL